MKHLLLALLCALPLPASLITVSFDATVTSTQLTSGGNIIDQTPYGPLPSVGDIIHGVIVYDSNFNTDLVSASTYGFYSGAPVSASVIVGPISSSFSAQATSPTNSNIAILNDHNTGVVQDGFDIVAGKSTGGKVLGGSQDLITNWRTSNLSALNSDAMQVLPVGLTFDLLRQVTYHEVGGNKNYQVLGSLNNYSVTQSSTPEPATTGLAAIAIVAILGKARQLRRSRR